MTEHHPSAPSPARRLARAARLRTGDAPVMGLSGPTEPAPTWPSSAPLPQFNTIELGSHTVVYRVYHPTTVLTALRERPAWSHLPDPDAVPPRPPVVAIHGFGGDSLTWNRTAPALAAAGHQVYALDLPAHGASSVTVQRGDLPEFVQLMHEFIQDVVGEPALLLGHSMGGLIAMGTATAHPELVRGLALVAPAGVNPHASPDFLLAFLHATSRKELASVLPRLVAGEREVSDAVVDYVWAWKRRAGVDTALDTIAHNVFTHGDARAAEAPAVVLPASELAAHGVPTIVVWGEDDTVIDVPGLDSMPSHAEVTLLAGVGHSPHLESVDELNVAVIEHFARVGAAVGAR